MRLRKGAIWILIGLLPIAMILFYGTAFFVAQGVLEVLSWFGIERVR